MTETARTITFAVVAAVSLAIAWFAAPSTDITPKELQAAKLGQPFFADFTNPNEPTSIRVVTFDEGKAASKIFAVKFDHGLWTIPSHHNYPADGADRLARTAASTIAIKREELRSDSDVDHEELGVVDPLSEDGTRLKGRGQRLTLGKGETVLMDLIIGKKVRGREGYYYVRVPEEKSTYVAKLDIDLSTKFADWVETDLLKMDRDEQRVIILNNYSIDEAKRQLVEGDVLRLDREKPGDPWKLEGMDAEKEELDTTKVTGLVNTVDDLRLVGVRPKPKGLRADLSIDPEFVQNQLDLNNLLIDMQSRGFILSPDRNRELHLYSNEGELQVATVKGVVYTLRFGEVFTGDEMEVEAGIEADKKKKPEEKKEEGDEPDKKASEAKSSRYLFVTTHFDEKYLGPRPEEPESPDAPKVKPKAKPEESEKDDKPAEKKEEDCGFTASDEETKDSDGKKDPPSEEKKDNDPKPAKSDPDEKKDPRDGDKPAPEKKPKTAAELKADYEVAKKKYEADLKAYEEKIKTGKERVEELNKRFGEWYYVISAESFNKLHLSRKDLVKEKTPAAGEKKEGDAAKTDSDPDKPEGDAKKKPEEPDESSEKPEGKPKAPEKKTDSGDEKKEEAGKKSGDAKPEE